MLTLRQRQELLKNRLVTSASLRRTAKTYENWAKQSKMDRPLLEKNRDLCLAKAEFLEKIGR